MYFVDFNKPRQKLLEVVSISIIEFVRWYGTAYLSVIKGQETRPRVLSYHKYLIIVPFPTQIHTKTRKACEYQV